MGLTQTEGIPLVPHGAVLLQNSCVESNALLAEGFARPQILLIFEHVRYGVLPSEANRSRSYFDGSFLLARDKLNKLGLCQIFQMSL